MRREKKGAALTETVSGLIVVVLVVLFLIDVISMVLCQCQHDAMVKDCARAAAEERSIAAGEAAALNVSNRWGTGSLFRVNSITTTYPNGRNSATLRVQSNITFKLPVPVPLMPNVSQQDFVAEAVEPIVGRRAGQMLDP